MKGLGYGVGATFVSRVARRHMLHAQAPVFIGLAVHLPTGASLTALQTCLAQIKRTGLGCRRGAANAGRCSLPTWATTAEPASENS